MYLLCHTVHWLQDTLHVRHGSLIHSVAAPIIGATKPQYLNDAAEAFGIKLTPEDIAYLEEPYVPHPIVGAIDKNPPQGVVLLDEKK